MYVIPNAHGIRHWKTAEVEFQSLCPMCLSI